MKVMTVILGTIIGIAIGLIIWEYLLKPEQSISIQTKLIWHEAGDRVCKEQPPHSHYENGVKIVD